MVLRVKTEEKTKTEAKAAKIPNSLVEEMDIWVKDGYYSSRADFMYCAIRDYIEGNWEACYDIYCSVKNYEVSDEIKAAIYNEKVRSMRLERHKTAEPFFKSKEEKTQIMVKLPKLINDASYSYYSSFNDLKSFQNFSIVAVITQLDYLGERFGWIDELGTFLEKPKRNLKDAIKELEEKEKTNL